MESRPTSLTISCETSISLGTGCLHLSAGWPSAFFPSALLIVRCTVPRYGGMITLYLEHEHGAWSMEHRAWRGGIMGSWAAGAG